MIQVSRFASISLLLVMLALISGCQSDVNSDQSRPDSELEVVMEMCMDPRPQICTMEFVPVCGVRDGGEKESFPNGCGACSNQGIVGYLPGECSE